MLKWIAFATLSVPIAYISRASLRERHSHGFYRFFAWEAILGLICLNCTAWFLRPFSWNQIVSWVLLFGSCVPLYYGVRSLVAQGKPMDHRRDERSILALERTSALVTTGVYAYIRHPLYSSLWYLAWGAFFKLPSIPGLLLASGASLALYATAKADEAECTRFFGAAYQEYMKRTKRFVPFVF